MPAASPIDGAEDRAVDLEDDNAVLTVILTWAPYYGEESVTESNVLFRHDIEEIIGIKQEETIIE